MAGVGQDRLIYAPQIHLYVHNIYMYVRICAYLTVRTDIYGHIYIYIYIYVCAYI